MQHASLAGRSSTRWPGSATDEQAERLVANLTLAILGCRMQAAEMAHTYLGRASALAQRLSSCAQTVRSTRPIMLARIHVTVGQLTEILLVPFAGGALAAPSIDLNSLMRRNNDKFGCLPTVDLSEVEIAYFLVRIRTARVAASIASLDEVYDIKALDSSATEVLRQCLQTETFCPDALDAAHDYFALARGFVSLEQTPLAVLCLNKAQTFLDSYAVATNMESHVALINGMNKRLSEIRIDLAAAAS